MLFKVSEPKRAPDLINYAHNVRSEESLDLEERRSPENSGSARTTSHKQLKRPKAPYSGV